MGEYAEYGFDQQRLIWYVFCLWDMPKPLFSRIIYIMFWLALNFLLWISIVLSRHHYLKIRLLYIIIPSQVNSNSFETTYLKLVVTFYI